MDARPLAPQCIVVMARPTLARVVAMTLRGEGYEVYRTPDDGGLGALVRRVRPHLVIIAGDLPWADAVNAPLDWVARLHPVPVLFIGETDTDPGATGFDGALLLSTVGGILGAQEEGPNE